MKCDFSALKFGQTGQRSARFAVGFLSLIQLWRLPEFGMRALCRPFAGLRGPSNLIGHEIC